MTLPTCEFYAKKLFYARISVPVYLRRVLPLAIDPPPKKSKSSWNVHKARLESHRQFLRPHEIGIPRARERSDRAEKGFDIAWNSKAFEGPRETGTGREAPSRGRREPNPEATVGDLFEWQAGSTTRVLFSRCISYLFIGARWNWLARFWRVHAKNESLARAFYLFPRDVPRGTEGGLERRWKAGSRFSSRAGESRSRSESGSDAGASTEPGQGAASALRCLPIASSSATALSSLCHLPRSLFPRVRPLSFMLNPRVSFPSYRRLRRMTNRLFMKGDMDPSF